VRTLSRGAGASMSAATFTADALLAIAMDKGTTPVIRLLCLAAERADRSGLATFDAGELLDLIYGGDRSAKTVEHDLRLAEASGYTLSGSTAEEVRLDLAMVQPEGFPEVGARYGDLALTHRVGGDKWMCKCACGSVRTYRLPYLESGITKSCGQHRPAA
jgi:hypothetical protein